MIQQNPRIPSRLLVLLLLGFHFLPISAQEVGVAFIARAELRIRSPQTLNDWILKKPSNQTKLKISTRERAEDVQILFASSDKRDFRNTKWKSLKFEKSNDSPASQLIYLYPFNASQSGSRAFFGGEIFFRNDLRCYVSSNVKVLTAKKRGSV